MPFCENDVVSLRTRDGVKDIIRGHAPRAAELWEELGESACPAMVFDFDSAVFTHTNDAMQRMVSRGNADLTQCTGRMLSPNVSDIHVDIVSRELHVSAGYRGPITLVNGNGEAFRTFVDMHVVRTEDGHRYGIDLFDADTVETAFTRRMLLVDDDPLVLKTLSRVCGRTCEVVVASNAHEAVRALSMDLSIGCVLSDVDMPGANGVVLYRACALFRPDLRDRFVLMSGRNCPDDCPLDIPFVGKPMSPRHLRELVEAVLAGAPLPIDALTPRGDVFPPHSR